MSKKRKSGMPLTVDSGVLFGPRPAKARKLRKPKLAVGAPKVKKPKLKV